MSAPDLMTVERAQEAFLRLYERARGGKRDRAPWRSRIEEEVALALDPAMKGSECDKPEEKLGRSKIRRLDPEWTNKPTSPRLEALRVPANVAAFILKAPALDRLLLLRSKKEGRAWELPGGTVEPGEYPWVALVREVTEESGADLLDLERTTIPLDGCEVFRGTSETERLTPSGDADEARWVTRTEASLLTLSDLPSARLIREWLDK